MDKLVEELDVIVNSGTKIDIGYYIDQVIDSDSQEIIHEYFMEADSDKVEEAFAELEEDDIEIEDIQLYRIKFMSEVAN